MRKKDVKVGMIVRIVSDCSTGTPRTKHPNVGAIARITGQPVPRTIQLYDCVRIDGGPAWRQTDGTTGHAGQERGFYAHEFQPVDPGIAHLYGVE